MKRVPVIFLAFANDKQTADGFLRNLTLERNQIREVLKKAASGTHPVCEVIVEPDATIDSIFNTFQNPEYRNRIAIFHYGGHAENFNLLLESAQGRQIAAHGEGLVPFLASQQGLQLVFLNGCSTQSQADALIQAGVPAVIGTTRTIPDQVAQGLSMRFYFGLGEGISIQNAWYEATLYIKSQSGREISGILRAHEDEHDVFPWSISYSKSSLQVREWNLPEAAGNPVFGLPELNQKYYLHLPESPYLGLKRFEQHHAGIFFGRNVEVRKLIDKIQSIYPVILYYGYSGIGKSSLLAAGLVPRLESTHQFVFIRHIHEQGLVHQLIHGLHSLIKSDIPKDLPGPQVVSALWQEIETVNQKSIVFVFDQFEELFIKAGVQAREELADLCRYLQPLSEALGEAKSGKIIFSFRSEYLPQIQDVLSKYRIAKTDLLLLPIGKQGIIEAITGVANHPLTAEYYRLNEGQIEGDFIEKVVVDLRHDPNSPIAPMLQILLTKLWDRAKQNAKGERTLSLELYNEIHKEGIALLDFLKTLFAEIRHFDNDPESDFFEQHLEPSGLILDVLDNFVTRRMTALSMPMTKVINQYPHRADVIESLISYLLNVRVLGESNPDGVRHISLSHDTLAPVVRELYDLSDRPGQRARGILEGKIYSSVLESHLDAADLAQVEDGLEGMRVLTQEETLLMDRSVLARNKEVGKQKIIRRLAIAAVALILAFGLASTIFWQKATQRAFDAETNRIAALSFGVFALDNTKGVNLAIEAISRQLNKETGLALSTVTGNAGPLYHVTYSGHEQAIFAICFSPDGKFIVTGSQDHTAKLWDIDGPLLQTFKGHTMPVTAVDFSPDGQFILTSSWDKTAKLWDRKGRMIHSYEANAGALTCATFSPDGHLIATSHGDHKARLWSVEGELLQEFLGHTEPVTMVIFSPDGKSLFTTSQDKTGKLWTIDGHLLQDFVGHTGEVYSAAFSPNGQHVVTGSWDQSAILWSLNGEMIHTYRNEVDDRGVMERGVMSVDFSPDGNFILDGSYDFRARLWSVEGELISTFLGHDRAVVAVAFSPDGSEVVTAGEGFGAKLWRLTDKRMQIHQVNESAVLSVDYSPDGEFIVTGDADHAVKLFDHTGKLIRLFKAHTQPVKSVTFSNDGKYILTGSADSIAILWSLEGDLIQKFTGHMGGVNCAVFASDENMVLTGSEDHSAILWKADGRKEQTFLSHTASVNSVDISENGKFIVTGSADHNAILWERDGLVIHKFDARSDVYAVAISNNGEHIYVAGKDQRARRWSNKGALITTYLGHAGPIASIDIDSEENYLLTGSNDRTMKLWTIDGIEVQSFTKFGSGVTSAKFSPDNRHILSGSYDRTVRHWLLWDQYHKEGILTPLSSETLENLGVR